MSDVNDVAQHGEGDAPTEAIAIDGGGALVDAYDETDLRLQVAIGERHFLATAEVIAGGVEGRRWLICLGRVSLAIAHGRIDGGVRQFPLNARTFFVQRHLAVLHFHDLAGKHLTIAPVQEAHRLAQVQLAAHRDDSPGIGQQAINNRAELKQLQATGVGQGIH